MASELYSTDIDELLSDAMELDRSDFGNKYSSRLWYIKKRPKKWKERVVAEYNGSNTLSLSVRYKTSSEQIEQILKDANKS
jgi:hypothetical protein